MLMDVGNELRSNLNKASFYSYSSCHPSCIFLLIVCHLSLRCSTSSSSFSSGRRLRQMIVSMIMMMMMQ